MLTDLSMNETWVNGVGKDRQMILSHCCVISISILDMENEWNALCILTVTPWRISTQPA